MILGSHIKQPAEIKDYDIDYAPWLTPLNDTLTGVVVSIESLGTAADSTLTCNAVFTASTSAKFWVAGGVAGNKYKLTATATTVGGRVDQSEILFVIKEF